MWGLEVMESAPLYRAIVKIVDQIRKLGDPAYDGFLDPRLEYPRALYDPLLIKDIFAFTVGHDGKYVLTAKNPDTLEIDPRVIPVEVEPV